MTNKQYLQPLIDILKIPSVSTQEKYRPDMKKTREFLVKEFNSMGFKTKILKGKKHDAVFTQFTNHHSLPTVLIYGHYDVQPPEPLSEWKTPPFEPTIKGDKIFARGSADDKGQFMIHLMAVKRLIDKSEKLKINFKFLIEGEEEIGSPSIGHIAKRYAKDLLKCDCLMVSDNSMRPGQPCIDIGLRGLVYTQIKIQTARNDVHSGEYGGIAENPINLLAHLISKLKDEKGRILIPGFYNDVFKLGIQKIKDIKIIQNTQMSLLEESGVFGLGGGENKYTYGERMWTQPTLDVNGITGGYQGKGGKTIIPSTATAKISMRLVPNQENDKIFKNFEKYVKTLVPKWAKLDITRLSDCPPYIAPTNHPVFDLMKQSLKKIYGKESIYTRTGGSIGFVPIMAKALKVPVVMVGFTLPNANIHAPNENFSLSNYYKGIEAMEDFYSNLRETSLSRV